MTYLPNPSRYQDMHYNRCGRSGLKLPASFARPVAQLRRRRHFHQQPRDGPAGI